MKHLRLNLSYLNLSCLGLCAALATGTLAAPARADETPAQTNASGDVISHASTATVQRALASRNLYQGKVDGVWGRGTEAALRQFQADNDLPVSGTIDQATADKLGVQVEIMDLGPRNTQNPAPGGTAKNGTVVQSAPAARGDIPVNDATSVELTALTPEQAKEMQQRLQLLGYYKGPIDGQVGPGTRAALRQFFEHQAALASRGNISNAAISLFGTEPSEIQRVSGKDEKR